MENEEIDLIEVMAKLWHRKKGYSVNSIKLAN